MPTLDIQDTICAFDELTDDAKEYAVRAVLADDDHRAECIWNEIRSWAEDCGQDGLTVHYRVDWSMGYIPDVRWTAQRSIVTGDYVLTSLHARISSPDQLPIDFYESLLASRINTFLSSMNTYAYTRDYSLKFGVLFTSDGTPYDAVPHP